MIATYPDLYPGRRPISVDEFAVKYKTVGPGFPISIPRVLLMAEDIQNGIIDLQTKHLEY